GSWRSSGCTPRAVGCYGTRTNASAPTSPFARCSSRSSSCCRSRSPSSAPAPPSTSGSSCSWDGRSFDAWSTGEGVAMRKIVLMLSVSLDGFISGPNGELDWQIVDDDLHQHFNDVLGGMSA